RYTFERPDWLPAVAREHRAARDGVAVFDQSSFAKLELRGPDAEAALQWLAAGYESDLTVSRLAPDAYLLVTCSAQRVRDADWIRQHLPPGARVTLADVTED